MKKQTTRIESDSFGSVEIEGNALWGPQSQRSLDNFSIGQQTFAPEFIHAFAIVKKAAAKVNCDLDLLDKKRASLIYQACDEILASRHSRQFPLSVWQTGSGTQTNMNLNEVIANRGNQIAAAEFGDKQPLHPNDHVNLSQSSNDVFPTAMHVTTTTLLAKKLFPAIATLKSTLRQKAADFSKEIKIGRTHLMDATPITLGEEFRAFYAQINYVEEKVTQASRDLEQLAIGGTAVGNGMNSHVEWADRMATEITNLSGYSFRRATNFSSQMASHDALTCLHGQLNLLATTLYKLASDIRLMNSGPRCGLSEISIPENEAGSSIMPGKVNPTQVEALTMVCLKVIGNNTAVTMANSQGQFQLNVFKPLMIHLTMESIDLLADAINSFEKHCLRGVQANTEKLRQNLDQSLMLVTALSPRIGYDAATKIAKHAHKQGATLRQAAIALNLLSAEEFDAMVIPESMLGPGQILE
jgi:fumarate hydratase class II